MRALSRIAKIIQATDRYITILAASFLIIVMLLNVANIAGRYLLNKPIDFTVELSSVFLIIVAFSCWGYTYARGKHVSVDLLIDRLPGPLRALLEFLNACLSLALFTLIAWAGIKAGLWDYVMHATTDLLRMPYFPFRFLIPLGAIFTCLEIMIMLFSRSGRQ